MLKKRSTLQDVSFFPHWKVVVSQTHPGKLFRTSDFLCVSEVWCRLVSNILLPSKPEPLPPLLKVTSFPYKEIKFKSDFLLTSEEMFFHKFRLPSSPENDKCWVLAVEVYFERKTDWSISRSLFKWQWNPSNELRTSQFLGFKKLFGLLRLL